MSDALSSSEVFNQKLFRIPDYHRSYWYPAWCLRPQDYSDKTILLVVGFWFNQTANLVFGFPYIWLTVRGHLFNHFRFIRNRIRYLKMGTKRQELPWNFCGFFGYGSRIVFCAKNYLFWNCSARLIRNFLQQAIGNLFMPFQMIKTRYGNRWSRIYQ